MTEFKHGLSGYVKHKCRCDVCCGEKSASQARWRASHPNRDLSAQRAANRRYNVRKATKKAIQARIDSGVPDDWTW